jgi:hypothetical protein
MIPLWDGFLQLKVLLRAVRLFFTSHDYHNDSLIIADKSQAVQSVIIVFDSFCSTLSFPVRWSFLFSGSDRRIANSISVSTHEYKEVETRLINFYSEQSEKLRYCFEKILLNSSQSISKVVERENRL